MPCANPAIEAHPDHCRVESFVGRHSIKGCALGHQHTLFLDDTGSIWGCGENKEGQCGLGTSLETMAAQRRTEWAIAAARGQVPLPGYTLHLLSNIHSCMPHAQKTEELPTQRCRYLQSAFGPMWKFRLAICPSVQMRSRVPHGWGMLKCLFTITMLNKAAAG